MFFGTYTPRLDDKGRLILPAKFRDQLREGLVVTKGQERCLYVWSTEGFAELVNLSGQGSFTHRSTRDFQRAIFASAFDEVPDKQGRFTVPAMLRAYAGLSRDCVVLGAMDRVEIWDAESWSRYDAANEEAYSQLSGDVVPTPD